MFSFLKKSIVAKTITLGFCLISIATIIALFFYHFDINSIPVDWAVQAIALIIFVIVLFNFLSIQRPLRHVIEEITALLMGRDYRHIYTTRIDEVGIIAHFFNKITLSLEKVSREVKEKRRMSEELNVGRQIQQDLLPKGPPQLAGLDIMAKTKPAVEIGGDAYDYVEGKNDNTLIYIGDFTGHGLPAGLGMIMVNTLIETFSDMFDNAYEIITNTNKYLTPLKHTTMFMTMVMFRWHRPSQEMFYVGAGHEHIVHYKSKTQYVEIKKTGGIAIGMIPNVSHIVKEVKLDFNEGDVLILYSDGFTEAKNASGERFGLKRVEENVNTLDFSKSAAEIFDRLSSVISEFVQGTIQEDDMTLMVIKRI